jgi:hypothetical protein
MSFGKTMKRGEKKDGYGKNKEKRQKIKRK